MQTILLLSAVMVVLFILGVVLVVFEPIGEKIPKSTIEIEGQGDSVVLHHLGGDSLSKERMILKINGDIQNNDNIKFINGFWPWKTGENIQLFYPSPDSPRVVEVYYLTGKGENILIDKMRLDPPPKVSATPIPVQTLASLVPTVAPTQIPVVINDANPFQPPAADFTADPKLGDPPLTVTFTDLTYGKVDSYLWSFGDGSTSTLQNPVHTYYVPGSYSVSLLVSNSYGSNRKSSEDFIVIGSPPMAKFLAEPITGQVPLTVQFTDLSTGSPTSWEWLFGDGSTSSDQNPVHTFQQSGSFNVTLKVTNNYGTAKYTPDLGITVNPPTIHDIYLTTSQQGNLEPDGYIRFNITDPVSSLKIAGKNYDLKPGDMVQLILGKGSTDGSITSNKNQLVAFNFADVIFVLNGEFMAEGPVNTINVGGYNSFSSTLNLTLPNGDKYDRLYIDQEQIKYVKTPQIRFISIGPDSMGRFMLQKSSASLDYQGGASGFTIS